MSTIQQQVLSAITAIVGLLVTFTIIESDVAQAVVGAASIVVPAVWNVVLAITNHGKAIEQAARIQAGK